MKKLVFAIFALMLLSLSAFAQEVIIPTQDFIMFLLQSLGGLKGASTLAIVYVAIQVLLKFLSTELFGSVFKNIGGASKLIIVLFLTMISGVLTLMNVNDLSIGAALMHSSTLAAFSVFANQLYKYFIEKKK